MLLTALALEDDMRTTVTLDDDVAALVEQVREQRNETFKNVLNEALRLGLRLMQEPGTGPTPVYRTRSVSLGRPKLPDVDNVAEALAIIEGDDIR
jgi:hypothetical protein